MDSHKYLLSLLALTSFRVARRLQISVWWVVRVTDGAEGAAADGAESWRWRQCALGTHLDERAGDLPVPLRRLPLLLGLKAARRLGLALGRGLTEGGVVAWCVSEESTRDGPPQVAYGQTERNAVTLGTELPLSSMEY